MNAIKGLIIKDLLNLKSYMKTIVLLLIFVIVFGISEKDSSNYTSTMMCVMVAMMALSTFSYDEIAKSDRFLLTLPTSRKEMVKAKYVITISLTILGGIIAFLISILIPVIMNRAQPNYIQILAVTLGGLLGSSIITSIQIPSIYKWGAERGRIQMFIVIFIVSALIGGIVYLASNAGIEVDTANIIRILERFGIAMMIVVIPIINYISYRISCRIYSKKEV